MNTCYQKIFSLHWLSPCLLAVKPSTEIHRMKVVVADINGISSKEEGEDVFTSSPSSLLLIQCKEFI